MDGCGTAGPYLYIVLSVLNATQNILVNKNVKQQRKLPLDKTKN